MAKEKLHFRHLAGPYWDDDIPRSWRKGREPQKVWAILHRTWVKAKWELEKASNLQYLGFGSCDHSGAMFICPSQKVARRTKALLIDKAREESILGVEISERLYTLQGVWGRLMAHRPDEIFIYEEKPSKGENYLVIESD